MSDIQILLVAVGLGTLIGLERKLNDKTAGIHTHALVALGAALFTLLGSKIASPTEASRVVSQVVMVIGFLGGAVVMRDGLNVRGLNTAVTLWCSSAIGAIVGAGYEILALYATVIVIVTNFLLHLVEHRMGLFNAPTQDTSNPKNDH